MSPKKIIKFFAAACLFHAILMAGWGAYESFSQSSTSPDWDWALRGYLFFASMVYIGLTFCAKNRFEYFKFFKLKIKWRTSYFTTAMLFHLISATNVSDYSLDVLKYDDLKVASHMIFTALATLSASVIAWHQYPKTSKARSKIYGPLFAGVLLFGGSLMYKNDWLTTAIGEAAITFFILITAWALVNEQVKHHLS